MSNLLSVNETVERLQRLTTAAGEFAAREKKLQRDFDLQSARIQREFANQLEERAAALEDQFRALETDFQTRQHALRSRYEQRKTRLELARESTQRRGLEQIEKEEGRRIYQAQKDILETERRRKAALKENDATLAEFHRQLNENRDGFVALEQLAAKSFRGYPDLVQLLATPGEVPEPASEADEYQLLEQLWELQTTVANRINRFRRLPLPAFFRGLPLWIAVPLAALAAIGAVPLLQFFDVPSFTYVHGGATAVGLTLLLIAAYYLGRYRARPLATEIARDLETARRLHNACLEKAQARHQREIERIEAEAGERKRALETQWHEAEQWAAAERQALPQRLEAKYRRITDKLERWFQTRLETLRTTHDARARQLQKQRQSLRQEIEAARDARLDELRREHEAAWQELAHEWQQLTRTILQSLEQANQTAKEAFPDWKPEHWADWRPPEQFLHAIRFGCLELDLTQAAEAIPQDPRLTLPGSATLKAPLVLTYPHQGSLLLETSRWGSEEAIAVLNNIIFRLLSSSPAGKASFTIIDPIKLGQNFAGIMHLADYEDSLINNRIWTQTSQIEQRLADLNEHMEKVIQMYLRNEYATIAEYNAQAGNIAEKYHYVVIADFPAGFSETAARRLLHIAASGARCGVYTFVHWDHRHEVPSGFLPEDLRKSSVCLVGRKDGFRLTHPALEQARVLLDAPPDPEFATQFLHRIGEACRGSSRVIVPFSHVAPPEDKLWSLDTTEELRVPIGRTGATKLQYLAIGRDTRQHVLIAGKTGSGKSTLFHVLITNLALWCSPEQVEFYLVDFKKGVEFKCYVNRRLPHARVVAIESDREFGLSVLQRVDEELKRRGELFRKLGVQDLPGYKRAGGTEPMPRCLLIIDEFQEFFVEDDHISQAAAVLLDRLVRQGRAFGIHVLLGSQTLGGAYTLARTTIGQMVVRIALQCNEADAYLIMDENNPAPRLLSRPGEGIYNDMAGAFEGNSPFQTVWLPDDERDARLAKVRALADREPKAYPGPIVFEGNAPAEVEENAQLRALLEAETIQPTDIPRMWLGAPNRIKGPTEAAFPKRSARNLLIVGQRDEASLAMQAVGLVALAAQFPLGRARFLWFDAAPPGSPERTFAEQLVRIIPHDVRLVTHGELEEAVKALAEDLQARIDENVQGPTTFVFIQGVQNFKEFRQQDDFSFSLDEEKTASPASQLGKLISEGPVHGIHVIARLDTYNNVNRFLGRKSLGEFEMRVLFQMSANDSASLCDDPKASRLGLHAALFYNEQEGYLETFRPYALPSPSWLDWAGQRLARLLKQSANRRPQAD